MGGCDLRVDIGGERRWRRDHRGRDADPGAQVPGARGVGFATRELLFRLKKTLDDLLRSLGVPLGARGWFCNPEGAAGEADPLGLRRVYIYILLLAAQHVRQLVFMSGMGYRVLLWGRRWPAPRTLKLTARGRRS
jgi:hypothetical protein